QGGLRRTVAVKVMSRELSRDPNSVKRFQREVEAAAALSHPNIVEAYDADNVGKTYFLVMEYVAGRDLNAYLQKFRRLPIGWACECARQAALGLQHAHEQGLVHRDVKPANLLVVARDTNSLPQVKILDMGLARFTADDGARTSLTTTGMVLGTIDYVAVEQIDNARTADIRSDLFSLGCTLYELLTGELPYGGENLTEKLYAKAMNDCPPPSSIRSEIPPELDQVVMKMAARERENRFVTPRDAAEALEQFSMIAQPRSTAKPPRIRDRTKPDAETKIAAHPDASLNQFLNRMERDGSQPTMREARALLQQPSAASSETVIMDSSAERGVPPLNASQWIVVGSVAGVGVATLLLFGLFLSMVRWTDESKLASQLSADAENPESLSLGFTDVTADDWRPTTAMEERPAATNDDPRLSAFPEPSVAGDVAQGG
ncbi:MAG: serine/threonine protein kinase, partial [Planctomycetales bacterium]